ncbi:MAG TPA: hypothetical protein VIM61_05855 [Chthoniobacterales bacterium]|jgi:hypothetical protein
MKLPKDAIIDPRKITHYLLVRRANGDKSRFLALAGYDSDHADRLIADLREQILPLDAEVLESTEHGQFYQIRTSLTGPTGRMLRVRTIWMTEHLSRQTKFVTLVPDKAPTA